jgi:hypothetical protein
MLHVLLRGAVIKLIFEADNMQACRCPCLICMVASPEFARFHGRWPTSFVKALLRELGLWPSCRSHLQIDHSVCE